LNKMLMIVAIKFINKRCDATILVSCVNLIVKSRYLAETYDPVLPYCCKLQPKRSNTVMSKAIANSFKLTYEVLSERNLTP